MPIPLRCHRTLSRLPESDDTRRLAEGFTWRPGSVRNTTGAGPPLLRGGDLGTLFNSCCPAGYLVLVSLLLPAGNGAWAGGGWKGRPDRDVDLVQALHPHQPSPQCRERGVLNQLSTPVLVSDIFRLSDASGTISEARTTTSRKSKLWRFTVRRPVLPKLVPFGLTIVYNSGFAVLRSESTSGKICGLKGICLWLKEGPVLGRGSHASALVRKFLSFKKIILSCWWVGGEYFQKHTTLEWLWSSGHIFSAEFS